MKHKTYVTLEVLWDDESYDHPSEWSWALGMDATLEEVHFLSCVEVPLDD